MLQRLAVWSCKAVLLALAAGVGIANIALSDEDKRNAKKKEEFKRYILSKLSDPTVMKYVEENPDSLEDIKIFVQIPLTMVPFDLLQAIYAEIHDRDDEDEGWNGGGGGDDDKPLDGGPGGSCMSWQTLLDELESESSVLV